VDLVAKTAEVELKSQGVSRPWLLVTFHTKVRSSGYGAEPPRPTMFKPRTSAAAAAAAAAAKKAAPRRTGVGGGFGGGGGGGGGAAAAKLQYPASSDPPACFQPRHQLPAGAGLSSTSQLNLSRLCR
jgi:hypothetical protein